MSKQDKEKEKQNRIIAQVLLDLQEDDDNPYDVSDEILVAYCEGKLSKDEAEIVKRNLANNPDALSVCVKLTHETLTLSRSKVNSLRVESIFERLINWIKTHKFFSLSSFGSTLATSFALVLFFSGNVYKKLDNEFSTLQSNPITAVWSVDQKDLFEKNLYQIKGSNDDYIFQGFRYGLKESLTSLVVLNSEQTNLLDMIPTPSLHCNNQLPSNKCQMALKQGQYLGRWVAMAFTNCHKQKTPEWINVHLGSAFEILDEAGLSLESELNSKLTDLKHTPTTEQCSLVFGMVESNLNNKVFLR